MPEPVTPLISMRAIHKHFPGVYALKGIDLELHAGEVLALVGENGAGKSTLIKTLGGAHRPSEGEILVNGAAVDLRSPSDAQAAGIGVIYQEFNLVPHLTARENIFLGRELCRNGMIRRAEESRRAQALFERIGVSINPETLCADLSTAEQQIVEIAKALSSDVKVLVLDEPSASLTPPEVEGLFAIIRDLQAQGIGMIYISHRLDEIYDICDRVMVLRDGEHVGTKSMEKISRAEMIEMMVGRNVEHEFPKEYHPVGEVCLEAKHLCAPRVNDVSFTLHKGEVLGVTGLVGAGRTETMRLLFGADRIDSGEVILHGKPLKLHSPQDAIQSGICLLTEDRKGQGLVLMHSVVENFGLPNLDQFTAKGFVRSALETTALARFIESIRIKISHQGQIAGNLSGGNQQKIVLAKWLQRNCDILIFDEPTRGIDVGAKYEIYMLMNELVAQGKSIIMISSEMPEVIGMSDRIIVMRNGEITGEVRDMASVTQQQLLDLAIH